MRLRFRRKPDLRGGKPADDMIFIILKYNKNHHEIRIIIHGEHKLQTVTMHAVHLDNVGNDSNLLIVFYVQIMPDDFVMQLHRF